MAIEDVLARISSIETLVEQTLQSEASAVQSAQSAIQPYTTEGFGAGISQGEFANVLGGVLSSQSAVNVSGASVAQQMVSVAEGEIGQSEQPPGSNDGPRIAVYRSAVAGAQPGEPWCADFVSWVAAQAGVPLGDSGTGFSSVAGITEWASRTGRLLAPGVTPQPGDLILFGDRHVGMVESVNSDGSLNTIEGNSSSAVSRVHRQASEATGFVRL